VNRLVLRQLAALVSIAATLASCTGPTPAPPSNLDATGILLVGVGEQVQSRPPNEAIAQALSDALELAEANGVDLGYPFLDPVSGELVVSAATPRGRDLLQGASIPIPYRIRNVTHGAGELRRIQDDVTFLGSRGVPDARLIFMTVPDHRDNRALIGISAMSRPLLEYLAGHYPPDALAVQVDPAFGGAGP
jgi:hypothetical protein